jgi:hypothetical protein
MSDDARVPQRPIGYRLPSKRLTLAHNSAFISRAEHVPGAGGTAKPVSRQRDATESEGAY